MPEGMAAVTSSAKEAVRRQDYRPAAWLVDEVVLDIALDPDATTVRARLAVRRNLVGEGGPLRLDGERMALVSLLLDGRAPADEDWRLSPDGLTVEPAGDAFTLETVVRHSPRSNTELTGLYMSGGNYITQCEAEGFRRITFFPDRPDVMARYDVTLRADAAAFPVLLSNGNPAGSGEGWARWIDPHPKPSYLFALVAGDLVAVRDRFTTRSGQEVALAIYVRRGDEGRCGHAMRALKSSMRWDEERFGLEYDLDVFNIVAVSDFNMGAMENKGLNIFNTRYVLASPETATDADYEGVETVVAHEYFHNWTGNRVTCRDWFQLSLKEGLTVYRDQEFSADQDSRAVRRIADVRRLRAGQFVEDAGPLAHPVRPETYVEINNFYTATVYQKGAEVVRMIETIIGRDAFRRGMDLYIARHDNQAVTIEDFVRAMEDASGADLGRFRGWYSTAGTPVVTAEGRYEAERRRFVLTLRQRIEGRPETAPLVIPVVAGLVGEDGAALTGSEVLILDEAEKAFVFEEVRAAPVPSLFRGFSAPVRCEGLGRDALRVLAAHDSDPFNRWDAGQEYAASCLLDAVQAWAASGAVPPLDAGVIEAAGSVLAAGHSDPAFAAVALALPAEAVLGGRMAVDDVEGIHAVREAARAALGSALGGALRRSHDALEARTEDAAEIGPEAAGRRALKNACLGLLAAAGGAEAWGLARRRFDVARNMTDRLAALSVLADGSDAVRGEPLERFHASFREDQLVLGKWFAIQAGSRRADTVDVVRGLLAHQDFRLDNPNLVHALLGSFSANRAAFHVRSGEGYALLAEVIGTIDGRNSQLAARLVSPFGTWRRFDAARGEAMRTALLGLRDRPGLTRGTLEMVTRSLG